MKKPHKILVALSTATLASCMWSGVTKAEVIEKKGVPAGLSYKTQEDKANNLLNDLSKILKYLIDRNKPVKDQFLNQVAWDCEAKCVNAKKAKEPSVNPPKLSASRGRKGKKVTTAPQPQTFKSQEEANKALEENEICLDELIPFYYDQIASGGCGNCRVFAGYLTHILDNVVVNGEKTNLEFYTLSCENNLLSAHSVVIFKNLLDDKYYVFDPGALGKLLPLEQFFVEMYHKYSYSDWWIENRKKKCGAKKHGKNLSEENAKLLLNPKMATAFLMVLISDNQK